MTSVIRLLVLSVATCTFAGMSSAQDATTADQKFKAALEAASKVHEEAVAAARSEYVAALKVQMAEETKKGNLDGAVGIRDKLKKFDAPAKESQSVLKKLAGTNWANTNSVSFQWKEDGTFYHNGKEQPCFALDAQRVAVVFGNSHIDILLFDEKFTKFEQFNTKGSDKPLMTGKRTSLR